MDANETPDFGPPATDPQTGIALDRPQGLPLNHRLRAEALVERGATTDPDGLIGDDLIADTAERVQAERKAEEDAAKTDPLRSVKALKAHVEKVTDPAELVELRAREAGGENRDTALAAIDARTTELAAAPPPPSENA